MSNTPKSIVEPTSDAVKSLTAGDEIELFHCAFCGRLNYEVDRIYQGPTVAICAECAIGAVSTMLLGHREYTATETAAWAAEVNARDERSKKPFIHVNPDGTSHVFGGKP